jgi:hypothetical protein
MTVTDARNWNQDCAEHGTASAWWNSKEQRAERAARREQLTDLWRRARAARAGYAPLEPEQPPQLREALKIMARRGSVVELTAPFPVIAEPDTLSQAEMAEIADLVTHTGVSIEALMNFRATVLRVDSEKRGER